MILTIGTLRFDKPVPKVFVEVDEGIVAVARALLPQPLRSTVRKQKYAPHISVVRHELLPAEVQDGYVVAFSYDPEPVVGDEYVWLRARSTDLTRLRLSLGLPPSSEWSRSPDGEECFHITIGNMKGRG